MTNLSKRNRFFIPECNQPTSTNVAPLLYLNLKDQATATNKERIIRKLGKKNKYNDMLPPISITQFSESASINSISILNSSLFSLLTTDTNTKSGLHNSQSIIHCVIDYST